MKICLKISIFFISAFNSHSTSASSSNQLPTAHHHPQLFSAATQPVITIGRLDGTKTIEIKTCRNLISSRDISTNITQISTLTTSTTTTKVAAAAAVAIPDTNTAAAEILDLSAFRDIHKLAFELSTHSASNNPEDLLPTAAASSSLTNETCNYLVGRFESFARDFNSKKRQAKSTLKMQATIATPPLLMPTVSSISSSLASSSCIAPNKHSASSSSSSSSSSHPPTTLYKKSTVIHDVNTKSSVATSIGDLKLLNRVIEQSARSDSRFVDETADLADENLTKLILNLRDEDKEEEQEGQGENKCKRI